MIVRGKNIALLTEKICKSCMCGCVYKTSSQRLFCSQNGLLSNTYKIKKVEDEDYIQSNFPKDFGKVVDLGVEFDEVKIDEDDSIPNRKSTKKKKGKNLENYGEKDFVEEFTDICEKGKERKIKLENSGRPKRPLDIVKQNSFLLRSILIDLRNRKKREKNQEISLEGKRLINDAIMSGFPPLKVFYSRNEDLERLAVPKETPVYKVSYKTFKTWGDTVTPQGVIGIFKTPDLGALKRATDLLPLTVICDNIRDPGNLGAILRVAAGVGCEKLILTKGCTDLWDPKVLRAGAGAHFKLPILNNVEWSDVTSKLENVNEVILADFDSSVKNNKDNEEEEKPLFQTRSKLCSELPLHCYHSWKYGVNGTVIVIGGETHGLSEEAYRLAIDKKGTRINIPMSNNIESLNTVVALGIILYEFRRQYDTGSLKNYGSNVSESEKSSQ